MIDEQSYKLNFTNEAGVAGRTRAAQEHRRPVAAAGMPSRLFGTKGERFGYDELMHMAEAAGPGAEGIIDPDDFLQPGDMPVFLEFFEKAPMLARMIHGPFQSCLRRHAKRPIGRVYGVFGQVRVE